MMVSGKEDKDEGMMVKEGDGDKEKMVEGDGGVRWWSEMVEGDDDSHRSQVCRNLGRVYKNCTSSIARVNPHERTALLAPKCHLFFEDHLFTESASFAEDHLENEDHLLSD